MRELGKFIVTIGVVTTLVGSGDVERFRAKMVGPTARRHSDRARTFLVLFSHRYVHRSQHCA